MQLQLAEQRHDMARMADIRYGAFLRGSMNRALGGLVLAEPLLSACRWCTTGTARWGR